jgi:hypothetical protein
MRHQEHSLHRPSSTHRLVNFKLERWHRRCIYATSGWLLITGVLWLLAHYLMRPVGEFGEAIHPLEPWSMKLHGAGAMVALFFIGSLMNSHIRRALKAKRNLFSGWAMIGALSALTISGYGLYYMASDNSRFIWSAIHWIIGLGFPALLILHIMLGRKRS